MYNLKKKIWPFGPDCEPLNGEVSEETKQWLIESGRAKEEDFEPAKSEKTKQK